jgi:hypothetical protein
LGQQQEVEQQHPQGVSTCVLGLLLWFFFCIFQGLAQDWFWGKGGDE